MVFASSLSGNKPFTMKEEVGFNFKKTFRKPNEKFTANKSNNMCTRCGGKPHYSRPCPALSKKNATPVKMWDNLNRNVSKFMSNNIQFSLIQYIFKIFAILGPWLQGPSMVRLRSKEKNLSCSVEVFHSIEQRTARRISNVCQ